MQHHPCIKLWMGCSRGARQGSCGHSRKGQCRNPQQHPRIRRCTFSNLNGGRVWGGFLVMDVACAIVHQRVMMEMQYVAAAMGMAVT
jgi:hypothetical protein